MRNSTLLLSLSNASIQISSFKLTELLVTFLSILSLSAAFTFTALGQKASNMENYQRIIKANNPFEISTISDGLDGLYLLWQEGSTPLENKVYFTHIDLAQKIRTNTFGKKISELSRIQTNPKIYPYLSNNAIVAWKDYSGQFSGELFLQRISNDSLMWNESGILLTKSDEQIFDYSLCSDKAGNIFFSYVTRSEYPSDDYNVYYQRILSDGSLTYNNQPVLIDKSIRKKNNIKIIRDSNGGAYLLWTEKINSKESLLLKKVDASGKLLFGSLPIKISGAAHNVSAVTGNLINNSLLYIVWESNNKEIYHQLINKKGKALWPVGGLKVTHLKGSNFHPKIIPNDSLITLAWLNKTGQIESLFAQRFKLSGNEIWNNNGALIFKLKTNISDYAINSDYSGGILSTWVYSNISDNCLLGVQRINENGFPSWDSLNAKMNLHVNCENPFLSVFALSDDRAIVTYKNSSNEISVDRITNFRADELDYFNLSSEINDGSVLLKLNSNIMNEKLIFIIERLAKSDTTENVWEFIGSFDAPPSPNIVDYEFTDNPKEFGTLYYRAILKSDSKELISNISRVDYLDAESEIIVAQNNPNPFTDSTVINFYLPAEADVGFEFFNGRVEKIGELDVKSYPAGENSVTFYRNGLTPGIYFFRFYTKDFVEVKKMMMTN